MKQTIAWLLKMLLAATLGVVVAYLSIIGLACLNEQDATEEKMEERIERYKDFPEKDGSESMFLDTRYTIRSC